MDRPSADVSAFQLAAELISSPATYTPLTSSSLDAAAPQPQQKRKPVLQVHRLLDDQRRFAHYDKEPHASVNAAGAASPFPPPPPSSLRTSAALQDAVMRWGTIQHTADGFVNGSGGGRTGSSNSTAAGKNSVGALSGLLRHSWRLVAAEQRPAAATSPTTTSTAVSHPWALGHRWERSDDLTQARALLQAVQHTEEERQRQDDVSLQEDVHTFYQEGLQLCARSAGGAATLPATLAAAPPASSLAFFSFTAEEYAALTEPAPRPVAPSTFTFTCASSCYLCTLWLRFGHPVVVVDRWAFGGGVAVAEAGVPVPSVEQVCAEYSRVTAGVLRQRQQRLLHAVVAQQQQQRGETAAPSAATTTARGERSGVGSSGATTTTAQATTPFVASFDRYALLHAAPHPSSIRVEVEEEEEDGGGTAVLPSQPSPPPTDPSSATPTVVVDDGNRSKASAGRSAASPPVPSPAQRLTQCFTPHPWYHYSAEVSRRAQAAELLRCEQATNVPYQQAAGHYLRLATAAAQALQRASFVFGDQDREEQEQQQQQQQQQQCVESATLRSASSHHPLSVPPRTAFTVRLLGLPQVDPAAWRAAETALREAAVGVLGSAAAAAAAVARGTLPTITTTTTQRQRGPRKRTRSAGAATSRQHTSAGKPTRRSARVKVEKEDADRPATQAADEEEFGDGSNEASQASDSDDEESGVDGSSSSSTCSATDDDNDEQTEDESSSNTGSSGAEEDDHNENGKAAGAVVVGEGEEEEEMTEMGEIGMEGTSPLQRAGGRVAERPTASSDMTYRSLQTFLDDVIPFRCLRLRVAAQAGWLLPALPPLPHSLTDPLEETEVGRGVVHERPPTLKKDITDTKAAEEVGATSAAAAAVVEEGEASRRPLLQAAEYQALRKVAATGVCNRVVSHTGEAVLLSLPPTLHRLHREVEQELERYLYDDSSAMMEVNATAQSLLAQIRTAYTQNTCLQRYTVRLENVVESLRKVEQECRDVEKAAGGASMS